MFEYVVLPVIWAVKPTGKHLITLIAGKYLDMQFNVGVYKIHSCVKTFDDLPLLSILDNNFLSEVTQTKNRNVDSLDLYVYLKHS